ncbi:MAG: hypothetical protein V1725_03385 [archaeon]
MTLVYTSVAVTKSHPNTALEKYIARATELGYSHEEITRMLLDVGWKREDIDNAYRS